MRARKEYAVYMRWPQNGNDWIHPEDVARVRRLIPSRRVFRREADEGRYNVFSYGKHRFRVMPTMHLAVDGDDLDIGDRVEVKSRLGKNHAFVGRIREMRWNDRYQRIEYYLLHAEQRVPRWYEADDLTALERKPQLRQPGT